MTAIFDTTNQEQDPYRFNPLCAEFFWGNKNIYLHFMSFLHIDMAQIVEFFPQVGQELTDTT